MTARAVVVAFWRERVEEFDVPQRRSMAFVITDDPDHEPWGEQIRRLAEWVPMFRVAHPGVQWEVHPVPADARDIRTIIDGVDR